MEPDFRHLEIFDAAGTTPMWGTFAALSCFLLSAATACSDQTPSTPAFGPRIDK